MSPPYSRSVIAAISGLLVSTAVSSRYSWIRPTSTCHTLTSDDVVGELDRHLDAGRGQRQAVRVEAREALLLVAVGVQPLAEVALGVQQADGDERQAEVGGRLEVVAGEHAEPAGVLRQRLGEPELGGEVGDELERGVGARPGTSADR